MFSFGGGDEEADGGEVFKVKKSSYSRRIAKELEKERKERKRKDDIKQNGQTATDITAPQPLDADSRVDSPGCGPPADIIVREIPLATDNVDVRVKVSFDRIYFNSSISLSLSKAFFF